MTLALNTVPARPVAQPGGQPGAARPAASERAAGFAAAMRQTGEKAREHNRTDRDATDRASPSSASELEAPSAPASATTAAPESASIAASDSTSSDATPQAVTAPPVAAPPTTFGWPAFARGSTTAVSGSSASAAPVEGATGAQTAATGTGGHLAAAIPAGASPSSVPSPAAPAAPAVPGSLPPASVSAVVGAGADAPAGGAFSRAPSAQPLSSAPAPSAPSPAPEATPTRTDFLVRPAGSAKAEAVTIVQADQGLPPATALQGAVAPTAATPAAAVAPAASATSAAPALPVPLTTQIAKPLFTLSGVKPGEHVLTISVTPENLGPLTVRAHVTGDNIRVELFAPTDLAREALRAILPDLRRDLAGGGLNAQLDLSSQNQANDARADAQAGRQQRPPPGARDGPGDEPPPRSPRNFLSHSSSTIDVMA